MNPPRPRSGSLVATLGAVLAGALLCSCASVPQTTQISAADVADAKNTFVQQLAEAPLVAGRTRQSPELRWVPGLTENVSNDRLSELDRRALVARVLSDRGVQELLRNANIRVIVTAEQQAALARAGVPVPPIEPETSPTHQVVASLRSISRAGSVERAALGADARKDVFRLDLVAIDLRTRTQEPLGAYEWAKAARGLLLD
jgi:hypothetical protein